MKARDTCTAASHSSMQRKLARWLRNSSITFQRWPLVVNVYQLDFHGIVIPRNEHFHTLQLAHRCFSTEYLLPVEYSLSALSAPQTGPKGNPDLAPSAKNPSSSSSPQSVRGPNYHFSISPRALTALHTSTRFSGNSATPSPLKRERTSSMKSNEWQNILCTVGPSMAWAVWFIMGS